MSVEEESKPKETSSGCRRGCSIAFFTGLVLFVLFFILVNLPRGPLKYYLNDPSDPQEIQALIGELLERVEDYRDEVDRIGDAAAALDADALFPLDQALIAIAVQRYRLKEGNLPSSLEDLYANGFLEKTDLKNNFYVYEITDTGWRLVVVPHNYVIARGN